MVIGCPIWAISRLAGSVINSARARARTTALVRVQAVIISSQSTVRIR